ncbi:MAG: hypothetical protein KI792_12040 [Alphaproteobacteria bacterium]|nr:hypothetical protein [Alphaproteobacteria bacterium SS10]
MTLGYEAGADSTNRYNDSQIKPRMGRSFWGVSLSRHDFDVTKNGERMTLKGNVFGTLALGLFMAAFLAFPGFMHLDQIMTSEGKDGAILFILPAIIITITGIFATLAVFRRAEVTVMDKALDIHWRSITGNRHRTIYFTEFAGVLSREYVVKRKNSSTTYQILELAHLEEKWSVPIKVKTGRRPLRDEAEALSKELGIPLLRQDGNSITARASDALDQTISEQVASGGLADTFDPNSQPPKGLTVEYERSGGKPHIKVHVEVSRLPRVFLSIFPVVGIIAGGAALMEGDSDAWFAAVLMGVMFVALPIFIMRMEAKHSRHLMITPEGLEWHDAVGQNFGVKSPVERLRMGDIEEVRVLTDNFMNPVIIAGDKGQMKIAHGLNKKAAEWLRGYLISAIANAPKAEKS